MESIIHLWPILAFIATMFLGGLGVAVGLTLWILGKLAEQDGRRIEMKEALLKESRDLHMETLDRLDNQHRAFTENLGKLADKVMTVDNRLIRVETKINGSIKLPFQQP